MIFLRLSHLQEHDRKKNCRKENRVHHSKHGSPVWNRAQESKERSWRVLPIFLGTLLSLPKFYYGWHIREKVLFFGGWMEPTNFDAIHFWFWRQERCWWHPHYGLRSVRYFGAKCWNNIPMVINSSQSACSFCQKLKSFFFENNYQS